ncbi:type II toxin-antitoxin system RelE family toxin [Burkholderia gladioli]|uniref:type II toxin-antitoxin system RelE family toxin n=1 Tax=Burkholderia gladioli TaxID=28095 RepID=UPI0006272E71|nr:type II toxin-antitoxin system RelE/ParE family toxin [Burkholderia gladioli]MBU9641708.1 type II toxin-antitoxin system RelE/ParE family toxin [Burkholderia gladioli]MDN7495553.1 type II toxin-antitoxin system RelE/ParE family toxin [Burkholderia gladioli]MDN7598563.1 type II toxin-antitoxin system RelE/ParE family toxin [Burkholderia gladioli]NRF82298.1 type II toxin-antitoxin system RelE/ParE family toxin [Burkholderia gladioli]
MKTYELQFLEEALKEWHRLDRTVREQFKKKLRERLEFPRVESARLHAMTDCYKIKLLSLGYRLVYQVEDSVITVTVIAVGKRERGAAYEAALARLKR